MPDSSLASTARRASSTRNLLPINAFLPFHSRPDCKTSPANPATTGTMPRHTNAGKKHRPSGPAIRTPARSAAAAAACAASWRDWSANSARPDVLARVNEMLACGYSPAAILSTLEPVNASLPPRAKVTADSLHKHRVKHFNLQQPAAALWRRIQEQHAAESANFESGVVSLLTPAAFFSTMMQRGFETMIDEATAVSPDQGFAAARELGKLTAQGDDELKWAQAHAQLGRVVAAFKELPPEYRQLVLAKVEGRPGPPPPGGGRRALIEGGRVTGDVEEFDPLDGGDDEFDPADDEDFEEED